MSSSPSQSKNASPTLAHMASCLRNKSKNDCDGTRLTKNVSFPADECNLVTGYMEPANPWEYADYRGSEELATHYTESCARHGTAPLPTVIAQIKALDMEVERHECFSLAGETLTAMQLEPLEEVLRRVQFKCLDMTGSGLDDEAAIALFDMLEYYESATHLVISANKDIGSRGWHACSRLIKKTRCLERLDARGCVLNEQLMPVFSRALKIATQLQVLKLEACWLGGRSMVILAAALRLNTCIKELYLADNELCLSDAIQLASLLRANTTLQLLDVSNNNLQDAGVGHLSDGLVEQAPSTAGGGLGILVLWNNRLTRNCSKHFCRALALSKTLGMLNVGHNVLGNECVHAVKAALQQNRTLVRLGMQSTHLTGEGAVALAECVADHPVIQRIDLRDNCLEVAGLMALALAMRVNTSVTQMDIDDEPKKKLDATDAEQYKRLVCEIRSYCQRNEVAPPAQPEPRRARLKNITSRKISLTCEMLSRSAEPPLPPPGQLLEAPRRSGGRLRSPAPSPTPSPVPSPLPSPSRQRFSVVKVVEGAGEFPHSFFPSSPSQSRFHVSRVEDPCVVTARVTTQSSGVTTQSSGFTAQPSGFTTPGPVLATTPACEVTTPECEATMPECEVTVGVTVVFPAPPHIRVTDPDPDRIPDRTRAQDKEKAEADAEVTRILDAADEQDEKQSKQLGSVSEEGPFVLADRALGGQQWGEEERRRTEQRNSSTTGDLDVSEELIVKLEAVKVTENGRVIVGEISEGCKGRSVETEGCKDPVGEVDGARDQLCEKEGAKDRMRVTESNKDRVGEMENNQDHMGETTSCKEPMGGANGRCVSVRDAPPGTSAAPAPPRVRKTSWIAASAASEDKIPSSLDKLIGLFHPGAFFAKPSHPASKPGGGGGGGSTDVANNNAAGGGEGDENFNLGLGGKRAAEAEVTKDIPT